MLVKHYILSHQLLGSNVSLSGVYRDWNFSHKSWLHLVSLTLQWLVSTKTLNTLKETDSFQLQVCLSIYDHLVCTRRQRFKVLIKLSFRMYLLKQEWFSSESPCSQFLFQISLRSPLWSTYARIIVCFFPYSKLFFRYAYGIYYNSW